MCCVMNENLGTKGLLRTEWATEEKGSKGNGECLANTPPRPPLYFY